MQTKTVNTIRVLSAEMVQQANSGHPGAPMGMAPLGHALWIRHAKHDATHPLWQNRDRIVLSSGHASAMLYTILHLCGYSYTIDDLKNFRQLNSITPGHPDHNPSRGIEVTTGPLGQGIANAVGMAIAETMLAEKFNRPGYNIIDHRTYAVCGDGCLMEGISGEASSLAGTLKLSKLTVLYDDNQITIEGSTSLAFTEDVGKRYEAYGWQVIRVKDGNDTEQVLAALKLSESSDRPTLIICPTIIGYGSEAKQGTASAHGEPLGKENLAAVKKSFGLPDDAFHVSKDVYQYVQDCMTEKQNTYKQWENLFQEYSKKYPELAEEWNKWHTENLKPEDLITQTELWKFEETASATRADSGVMINRLAQMIPNLIGGSADLAPSNKTTIQGGGSYSADNRSGRNLHFGVREHAMGAICNGIAAHGGLRVFCGTFLVFSDYMKNAIRLSALMKLPVTYVFTHDSIGVGEDGETHQPIEHLTSLRSIPDVLVYRPADGHETAAAWIAAITSGQPVCIALTRQNVPNYQETSLDALHGGYIVKDSNNADILLIATGSELQCAVEAEKILRDEGIHTKVVSMPCMELFLEQPLAYQEKVLPSSILRRVSIEAASTMPWYRFVGLNGIVIGLDHFGASAPAEQLFRLYGIDTLHVVEAAKSLL